MNRDLATSVISPEYSYENINMRITNTQDNTLLSMTNERGTKYMPIQGLENNCIKGIPVGQCVIDNNLVVFTTGTNDIEINGEEKEVEDINVSLQEVPNIIADIANDKIYKLWYKDGSIAGEELFSGFLNFNPNYPIQTLASYENEQAKKVYWIDGLNQTRVINIAAQNNTANTFNFSPRLYFTEKVTITRNDYGGQFPVGVIQYVCTYIKKYAQETNIFYTSPLYYSYAEGTKETSTNSYTITIEGSSQEYTHIRVYSIIRTSINSTPVAKLVSEVPISEGKLTVIDTGTIGSDVDPIELLYVGGEIAVFNTFTQKDNTLFLGNYTLSRELIPQSIRLFLRNAQVSYVTDGTKKYLQSEPQIGFYPYKSVMNRSSQDIKYFKYLEWYRFGIQFQHYTGKWSEPIFVCDKQNDVKIDTGKFWSNEKSSEQDLGDIKLPYAQMTFDDSFRQVFSELMSLGYVNARPVVVYPSALDRECVCQGILCPTVYNTKDRCDNSPFVQSSWFTRPNAPLEISQNKRKIYIIFPNETFPATGTTMSIAASSTFPKHLDGTAEKSYEKSGYIIIDQDDYGLWAKALFNKETIDWGSSESNTYVVMFESKSGISPIMTQDGIYINTSLLQHSDYFLGSICEFRHNYPIPSQFEPNGEIQGQFNVLQNPNTTESFNKIKGGDIQYFVDSSIVTMHSPELEYEDITGPINIEDTKLRIIGAVPLMSTRSLSNIAVTTAANYSETYKRQGAGVVREQLFTSNQAYGYQCTLAANLWNDFVTKSGDTDKPNTTTDGSDRRFMVYPWHRQGPLNNTTRQLQGVNKSAMLDKKKHSVYRVSFKPVYLDNIWNVQRTVLDIWDDPQEIGIRPPKLYSSKENDVILLDPPLNSYITNKIVYQGNIDRVVTPSDGGYPFLTGNITQAELNNDGGESIVQNPQMVIINDVTYDSYKATDQYKCTDPVRIKYKTTPHAVIVMDYEPYTYLGEQRAVIQTILPQWTNKPKVGDEAAAQNTNYGLFWYDQSNTRYWGRCSYPSLSFEGRLGTTFPNTSLPEGVTNVDGYLWLGELYRDNVQNRFGGQTEEAFEQNQWLPCGDSVPLADLLSKKLICSEGDTYFQRYDCIKTYPATLTEQNAVTDIVSFMCETHINIDGRTDNLRNITNDLVISGENLTKINSVYSQDNNFFNYRGIVFDGNNTNKFPNQITWTLTKNNGASVDEWTKITLASTLDLDGNKGTLTSLNKYNNDILAFQEQGISQILYNENYQVSTTQGVPIEIANSGKVSGKRYISNTIGCQNKWSILESSNSLYFIDDIGKALYAFGNEGMVNISDQLGFHSWMVSNSSTQSWDPVDFNNKILYYDYTNKELFIITKDTCLTYSEQIKAFTSFYSYGNVPYVANLNGNLLAFNSGDSKTYRLWALQQGQYNMFFNKYQPFSTTIVANQDPTRDKIFNNLEFRADTFKDDTYSYQDTFDTLEVWNEYQRGTSNLTSKFNGISNLKKKFRIWRALIPRDANNHRDRMRNPWLYIKLSKNTQNIYKTVLHDIQVSYFV